MDGNQINAIGLDASPIEMPATTQDGLRVVRREPSAERKEGEDYSSGGRGAASWRRHLSL